jgi:hypothetical protein
VPGWSLLPVKKSQWLYEYFSNSLCIYLGLNAELVGFYAELH